MSHRNARLTPFARRLIVERVRSGQPVAHVAKAMGVSRQCAHRWINRFNEAGLETVKWTMNGALTKMSELNKAFQDGEWDTDNIPPKPTAPVVLR